VYGWVVVRRWRCSVEKAERAVASITKKQSKLEKEAQRRSSAIQKAGCCVQVLSTANVNKKMTRRGGRQAGMERSTARKENKVKQPEEPAGSLISKETIEYYAKGKGIEH